MTAGYNFIEQDEKENINEINTQFNNLTGLLRKAIKEYTEKRWSHFLGKLGPYPASSSLFWQIINKARTQKKSSSIPNLLVNNSKNSRMLK